MATGVSIELFGDEFFRRRIQAMRYRARDMSPILKEIGNDWQDITEEQFDTEGRRGGAAWKQLARETKFNRGNAHPILIHFGDMFDALITPGNIHVTDSSVTMRLPLRERTKAEAHQFGFFNVMANKDVPARPWIAFTELDRKNFARKITDYLVNGDGA
jgi:phage gpG-like protein